MALTYEQIAELADLIIEHQAEAPFEIARAILQAGWLKQPVPLPPLADRLRAMGIPEGTIAMMTAPD